MNMKTQWISGIMTVTLAAASPLTAYAGWETSGGSYRYRQEDGSYAASQWIEEGGVS